jgi:hypothetical protein
MSLQEYMDCMKALGFFETSVTLWHSPWRDLPKGFNLEGFIFIALEIYNVKCVLQSHVLQLYSNSDDYKILHVY